MMRVVKPLLVVIALVCLARYFPVFYYATQYNDFVKEAPKRSPVGSQLQKALLDQASMYFLPVRPNDIQIKENGELIQVKVDYRVPVDFFIFKHELTFHASGAGLIPH